MRWTNNTSMDLHYRGIVMEDSPQGAASLLHQAGFNTGEGSAATDWLQGRGLLNGNEEPVISNNERKRRKRLEEKSAAATAKTETKTTSGFVLKLPKESVKLEYARE